MNKQNRNIQIVLLLFTICLIATRTEKLDAYSILVPEVVSPVYTMIQTNKPKHTPRITFEHTNVKLGNVRPNKKYTCKFPFKNTGTALLEIKGIQSTCRCSTPELTKKEYAPGESGIIIVHFQSSPLEGNMSKHLYVLSNASDYPRAMLTIKAAVVVPWEVVPQKIELDYRAEQFGIVPITVRSKDGSPFRITSAASCDNAITLSLNPDKEGAKHILRLKVNAKLIKKGESGRIVIKTTHPEFTILSVPYTIRPEFKVFPQRIIFFDIGSKEPSVRHITVRNNYGEEFKVVSAKSLKGYTRVLSMEQDGPSVKLAVVCQLSAQTTRSRYLRDDLEIRISGDRTYKIPCNIWFKGNHQSE